MFKKSSKTTKRTDSSAQSTDLSHRAKSRLQKILNRQNESKRQPSSSASCNDQNECKANPPSASGKLSQDSKAQSYTLHNTTHGVSETCDAAKDGILEVDNLSKEALLSSANSLSSGNHPLTSELLEPSVSSGNLPLKTDSLASTNQVSEDDALSKEELFDKILKESPVQVDEESSNEKLIIDQSQPAAMNDESNDKVLDDSNDGISQSLKVYPVVVYTAQELAKAQKSGAERILVKGQLASKLETALKAIKNMSASTLNTLALVLSGAALLAPFTGGVSLGAAGTVMGTLGAAVTAAAIAAISAIGLSLVIAVVKGYDEVKISGGGLELVIKKQQDKKEVKVQMASDNLTSPKQGSTK